MCGGDEAESCCYAIWNGDFDEFERNLAQVEDVNEEIFDNTLLLVAAINSNQPKMVERLLERGADPNLPERQYPLRSAVHLNRVKIVKLLLQHGAND